MKLLDTTVPQDENALFNLLRNVVTTFFSTSMLFASHGSKVGMQFLWQLCRYPLAFKT